MPKTLLIIDLDGTLVDSQRDIVRTLNSTLTAMGLATIPEAEIISYVAHGITPLVNAHYPDKANEILTKFGALYAAESAVESTLFPGWSEALDLLKSVKKVILTNKPQRFTNPLVKELGIEHHFQGIYGREAFAECKPSPVPILEILSLFSVPAREAVMIGDTDTDMLTAQRAGVDTCAVMFGYGDNSELLALNPTFTIKSPLELMHLISK